VGINAALYLRIQTPGTAGADALACDVFPGNSPNLVRVSEWTDGVQSVLNSTTGFDVGDSHKVGCEALGDQLCAYIDIVNPATTSVSKNRGLSERWPKPLKPVIRGHTPR
jgi:hypothetical protein